MFNFLKKKDNFPKIIDIVPSQDVEQQSNTLEPKAVQNPTIIYHSIGKPNKRRGIFDAPEYDLYEIGRIDDVDSYVHQAFKKKVGLFLKEGFDYVGSNKKVVNYIKTRFQQIAIASNIAHNELIRRCAIQFIKKSNAFLIKVRDPEASGGKVRMDINENLLDPVAGYFPVPAETMEADVDISGKPTMWRQRMPNGIIKEYLPQNVIHFTFDRKEGLIFGTPIITPVIDDIRALRKIEENIELLIYKHLFPMFQYIVGTETAPARVNEDGIPEVEIARQEIRFMPTEGGIVTPERHEIKMIGAESRALRAEAYLEHFKRRVFSGLGMSSVDYGEADTSNRSTADNMSRALVDDIKDFQDAFEVQWNHYVIGELLLESTFKEDLFSDENRVDLVFREIDIDKQIKVETHAADLYAKNATSYDELREAIGRDPMLIPEDPEDQDVVKYKNWHGTFWKLFHEPEVYLQASKGQPYSPATAAAAASRSTSLTSGDIQGSQEAQHAAEVKLAVAKEKAKPRPIIRAKNNFLSTEYFSMRELVETSNFRDMDYISKKIKLISDRMINLLKANMNTAFLQGIGAVPTNLQVKASLVRRDIERRAHILINRLAADILSSIRRKIDTIPVGDKISTIRMIFDAFKYRTDFITETEIARARNLGKIIRYVDHGAITGKLIITDETCSMCVRHSQNLLSLESVSLSDIPPHHNGCKCGLQVEQVQGN